MLFHCSVAVFVQMNIVSVSELSKLPGKLKIRNNTYKQITTTVLSCPWIELVFTENGSALLLFQQDQRAYKRNTTSWPVVHSTATTKSHKPICHTTLNVNCT